MTEATAATPRAFDLPVGRRRDGKLLGLQVLRFAAAFAVVLFHVGSGYQIEFGNEVNPFAFGAAGVDVFFVLSGFIIALTTDPARGTWHFCRRRLVRVVPLYWVLTLGVAMIGLMLPSLLNSTSVTLETLFKSLLFIPYEKPNGAIQPLLFLGWTLNYEMFFYAIYATCLLLGLRSPLAPVMVVLLLVSLGRILSFDNTLWHFYSSPLMIEFALGVGIYLAYDRHPHWFAGRSALFAGFALATFILFRFLPSVPWLLAGALPAAILMASFVAFAPSRSGRLGLLVLLGDASYSLYLVHPYIIQLLSKVAPADLSVPLQLILGSIACAFCIATSLALYRLVELRSQRFLMPQALLRKPEGQRLA
ncbi:acyltransferase family protein [Rubellimicrobium rubrum]|uniref:acyltransferase family protein n=1 Tax=Rubellimicrobium rubrum TaxID=2585369 RepID=UPI00159B9F83|nr:acyltransferase [Rubellimicrobium rubrum]